MDATQPNYQVDETPLDEYPADLGLQLISKALSYRPKLFPLSSRKSLRTTCSALKLAVKPTMTTASFTVPNEHTDPAASPLNFAAQGWAETVEVLEIGIGLPAPELAALLRLQYPKLRELKLTSSEYSETNDVGMLAFAMLSHSFETKLDKIRLWMFPLEAIGLQIFFQGRWLCKTLEIEASDVSDIDALDEVDFSRALPCIEEIIVNRSDGHGSTPFPNSLLRADLPYLKRFCWKFASEDFADFTFPSNFKDSSWVRQLESFKVYADDGNHENLMDALALTTNLKELQITSHETTICDYKLPANLFRLEYLKLKCWRSGALLNAMMGVSLPSLETLHIHYGGEEFTELAQLDLSLLPHVRHFVFDGPTEALTADGIVNLGRLLPRLTTLQCKSRIFAAENISLLMQGVRDTVGEEVYNNSTPLPLQIMTFFDHRQVENYILFSFCNSPFAPNKLLANLELLSFRVEVRHASIYMLAMAMEGSNLKHLRLHIKSEEAAMALKSAPQFRQLKKLEMDYYSGDDDFWQQMRQVLPHTEVVNRSWLKF